jgi:hypothetical protein
MDVFPLSQSITFLPVRPASVGGLIPFQLDLHFNRLAVAIIGLRRTATALAP